VGLIYLDACLLIYLVEKHQRWGKLVAKAMENATDARFSLSPLTKCECLVGPLKQSDSGLQLTYQKVFERFLSLDIPEVVYLNAAELRARFGLKTPDALHLACAQHHGCTALWTNDDRLKQAGQSLACNMLSS
jgi:predicted nucleic acid-binding protein